eukprot:GFKZ01005887.1.p1 GENE.GFKZ01005887.1~~GFKZ01005887.1.p1  ORF type:complete len:565 (+),score=60.33 GFKZ01005887.1:485-2179(+)
MLPFPYIHLHLPPPAPTPVLTFHHIHLPAPPHPHPIPHLSPQTILTTISLWLQSPPAPSQSLPFEQRLVPSIPTRARTRSLTHLAYSIHQHLHTIFQLYVRVCRQARTAEGVKLSKTEWSDVLPALLALQCREVTVKSVQWDQNSKTWLTLRSTKSCTSHKGKPESRSTKLSLNGGKAESRSGTNEMLWCRTGESSSQKSFSQNASEEYLIIPRTQPAVKRRFSWLRENDKVRVLLLGGEDHELADKSLVMAVVGFPWEASAQPGLFLPKPDAVEFVKMIASWREHAEGIKERGEIEFLTRIVKESQFKHESYSKMDAMFCMSQELASLGKAYMEVVGEADRRVEAVIGMEHFLRFGATYMVLRGRKIKFQRLKLAHKDWEDFRGKMQIEKVPALVEEETIDASCEGDSSANFSGREIRTGKKEVNLGRLLRRNGQPPRKRFCDSNDKSPWLLGKEQHVAARGVRPQGENGNCTPNAARWLRRKIRQGHSNRSEPNVESMQGSSKNGFEDKADNNTGLLRELRQSAIALREAGMTAVAERVMQRFLKIVDCGASTPIIFPVQKG